jgi:hypothetical protein
MSLIQMKIGTRVFCTGHPKHEHARQGNDENTINHTCRPLPLTPRHMKRKVVEWPVPGTSASQNILEQETF